MRCYSLPLLDDTLCTPAKSPEVDEVAFQESSPANHSSPEGKLIDGKEVPLAENGIWLCCVCMHENVHHRCEPDSSESKLFDPTHGKYGNECG